MKLIKVLFKLVLCLIALVVVALLAMPLWFGPVVKAVANSAVPKVVKADFHMGHLSLNPYTARFELGDMKLSNPEGYPEQYAVTLGEVVFDAETKTLPTDVIHIEELLVKDVFVSYVDGGPERVNNFQQIQYNVAGGKEKYEAAKAAKEQQAAMQQPTEAKSEKPSKKFVIDRLEISGISMKLGVLPVKIPVGLKLTDIGKDSGGATMSEISEKVWAEVMKAAGAVGEQFKALGSFASEKTKALSASTGKAIGAGVKSVGAATGAATEKLGSATGAATEKLGSATGAATEAVGKGAKSVGDGAKKALDSIKGLW